VYKEAPGFGPGPRERERCGRVYKEAPGFRPAPRARERRYRVYKAAPGFRPGPRVSYDVASNSCQALPVTPATVYPLSSSVCDTRGA